ncbi:MAG TPA: HEAT repeat domain-containing protein, partial [Candidatus Acidoferrum sp.]|jgi:hypothetical protein|nr:HEAT repeat domain-containing protein [Candidatus Acidoferrum sp.]
LFAFGLYLLRGARREPVAPAVQQAAEALGPDAPLAAAEDPLTVPPETESIPAPRASPEIRWSKRFDPVSGPLDDEARLKLIRELAFVRGAWCIPLLAQAYEEESAPEHRRAVLTALAAYRHPDARSTFETALSSSDDEERSIAQGALGTLATPGDSSRFV